MNRTAQKPARILITGADGLLGTSLNRSLAAHPETAHWTRFGVSLHDFDITDADRVIRSIASFEPDIVVHSAANAIVDDCELAPRRAAAVNAAGTRNVATACAATKTKLVYISSDYIFDGNPPGAEGFSERDLPAPLNVYGLTKLAGEAIARGVPGSLVVRTSWLFGGADERVDPVLAMVNAARQGRASRLIADQFSRPTYVEDLAAVLIRLIVSGARDTMHVANQGRASWFDVGNHLTARAPNNCPSPVPIRMADAGFLADRPQDSTLSTARLEAMGIQMPSWQSAVDRFALPILMACEAR